MLNFRISFDLLYSYSMSDFLIFRCNHKKCLWLFIDKIHIIFDIQISESFHSVKAFTRTRFLWFNYCKNQSNELTSGTFQSTILCYSSMPPFNVTDSLCSISIFGNYIRWNFITEKRYSHHQIKHVWPVEIFHQVISTCATFPVCDPKDWAEVICLQRFHT